MAMQVCKNRVQFTFQLIIIHLLHIASFILQSYITKRLLSLQINACECIYACQQHWLVVKMSTIVKVETADTVSNSFNSDPLPGQLSSNSVFIGKQNPELCQLSFICVHSQHLTLVPNHPSHDTTAAPEGLSHSTSPARMLMSL